jgi:putative transposase
MSTVKVRDGRPQMAWSMPTPKRRRVKKRGPKRNPARRDPDHRARPVHQAYEPVHVVLRTLPHIPKLRGFEGYRAVRGALARIELPGFRVIHTSIQRNHLHFIVEADDKQVLGRGMQGLGISVAKRINRELARTGKVFAYRYHATAIRTPRQARNALAYVLNNWRHHQEPASGYDALDPFATGYAFDGWSRATGWYENWAGIPSASPETWLLKVGWQRGGGAIDPHARP